MPSGKICPTGLQYCTLIQYCTYNVGRAVQTQGGHEMAKDSSIEWTHHTFNPWWGCTKVSPGCKNCYAETFSHRIGQDIWGRNVERRFFSDAHWREPLKWNAEAIRKGARRRVFC